VSDPEQYYQFIDKSGTCFDDFAAIKDDTDYHRMVASRLSVGEFSVGDMLVFRDELQAGGFEWGSDFFVRKIALGCSKKDVAKGEKGSDDETES